MAESLGARIKRIRTEQGISATELANSAYISKAHLSNIESGRYGASDTVLSALGRILQTDLVTYARKTTYPVTTQASTTEALVLMRQPDGSVGIVRMDRRAFLTTATATAATALPLPQPDRVTPEVVTALSDRIAWHGAAGRIMHPDVVSRTLCADLDVLNRTIPNAPRQLRPQLLALGVRYTEYLGWMRQEAGDVVGALHWTGRAADFAQAAQWWHMVAFTLARTSELLRLQDCDHAVDLARTARTGPWKLTPGLKAIMATYEAEANAHAGHASETTRLLDLARDQMSRMDIANEPAIGAHDTLQNGTLTDLVTGWCDLLLGRAEAAIDHLAPAVATAPNLRRRAIDGARLSLAYARAGAIDDATQAALSAAQHGASCSSATATGELRLLRPVLEPWSGRSDVEQVLAALPA